MSDPVPAALRRAVIERAGRICEYCLFRETDSALDFQIEHIISQKHGGATEVENLALACPFCNRHKGSDIASISPTSGALVRLYHPRRDDWSTHFQISGALIVSVTEIGEATARLLRFNDEDRITERRLLQTAGRYPSSAFT